MPQLPGIRAGHDYHNRATGDRHDHLQGWMLRPVNKNSDYIL